MRTLKHDGQAIINSRSQPGRHDPSQSDEEQPLSFGKDRIQYKKMVNTHTELWQFAAFVARLPFPVGLPPAVARGEIIPWPSVGTRAMFAFGGVPQRQTTKSEGA